MSEKKKLSCEERGRIYDLWKNRLCGETAETVHRLLADAAAADAEIARLHDILDKVKCSKCGMASPSILHTPDHLKGLCIICVDNLRAEALEEIARLKEKCFNDTMAAKKSGYDEGKAESAAEIVRLRGQLAAMREEFAAFPLARRFHETYERLAPELGYRTREASAVPWSDVPDLNKRLMIATCQKITDPFFASNAGAPEAAVIVAAERQASLHTRVRELEPQFDGTPVYAIGEGYSEACDKTSDAVKAMHEARR